MDFERGSSSDQISPQVTVIIPAKNEAQALEKLLPRLLKRVDQNRILVIDDGSTDDTKGILEAHGVQVIRHEKSLGNGAAIKAGLRLAGTPIVVCMDADGQHDPAHMKQLVDGLEDGYDMVVGARGSVSQASMARRLANGFYNRFASWMTGSQIDDLTSGYRACRTEKFIEFIDLLPNGFSYPTTITMAFIRSGYPVAYEPVPVSKRIGKSHIRVVNDGLRFLLIIFKIGTLFSPMKIFFPISIFLAFIGISYSSYTIIVLERFTNMGATLLTASVQIFLMGLISEQITNLQFSKIKR